MNFYALSILLGLSILPFVAPATTPSVTLSPATKPSVTSSPATTTASPATTLSPATSASPSTTVSSTTLSPVTTPTTVSPNIATSPANSTNSQPTVKPSPSSPGPLILTQFIEKNLTDEARKLSEVNPSLFLNISSHSGFLTVDKRYNSNTFFWYFPVAGKPVNETPWIIWLQGGPGASSLNGLFDEIGPFQYHAGTSKLTLRESTWWRDFSMVFIDNPVGSGYSFTDNDAGYATNMNECGTHLYTAVSQLVTIYPELGVAPLYVAGESYAGKYVPALATEIMRDQTGRAHINLQGIILGNPVIDHADQSNFSELFYQWGLLDSQGLLAVKQAQDAYTQAVNGGTDGVEASKLFDKLLDKLQAITQQYQLYNILKDNDYHLDDFRKFLGQQEVGEALHVADRLFGRQHDYVHKKLSADFLSTSTKKIEALLEHYKVLIYCGQLDAMEGCTAGAAARRGWQWSHREQFLAAPRKPWAGDNDTLSGYVKSGGSLTEVLVRGAGHLAPIDKPKQVFQLVSHFIRGLDLPVPSKFLILPDYTPPKPLINPKTSQGTTVNNTGVVVSIILNVILVLTIVAGVIFYLRMKRKYDMFYYDRVDNVSDEIFLT